MTMTRRRLLDDTFKKSVVGNPAIAQGSLARMYPGIEMEGWTEQDGTPTPEAPVPIVSAGTKNQDTGKWEYEIEVGCGNLFDISKSENNTILIAGGGTRKNSFHSTSDYISVIPGVQYSRIIKEATGNFFYDKQKQYISATNGSPFTIPENAKYVRFSYNIVQDDSYKKIILNPGAILLPYTPYRPPQTVTLTADRPLTKWDRLEKRNGQWGWVYKSNEKTYDGSADENWLSYTNSTYRGFQIDCPDSEEGSRIEGFCDKFPVETSISGTDSAIWIIDKTIYLKNVNPKYASSVEEWKTWLQSNNIKVLYQTADETFVPLTASEQEAMNALYTYRPTTVLSNQQDCEMALTYKTRKGMS